MASPELRISPNHAPRYSDPELSDPVREEALCCEKTATKFAGFLLTPPCSVFLNPATFFTPQYKHSHQDHCAAV
jgi:hypothetical protein